LRRRLEDNEKAGSLSVSKRTDFGVEVAVLMELTLSRQLGASGGRKDYVLSRLNNRDSFKIAAPRNQV